VRALLDRRFPKIRDIWLQAARAVVNENNRGAFMDAARSVADAMIKYMHKGVAAGELRAVKPSTQKRKDREGLRPGLPPMVRTGQFLRSMISDAFAGRPRWK